MPGCNSFFLGANLRRLNSDLGLLPETPKTSIAQQQALKGASVRRLWNFSHATTPREVYGPNDPECPYKVDVERTGRRYVLRILGQDIEKESGRGVAINVVEKKNPGKIKERQFIVKVYHRRKEIFEYDIPDELYCPVPFLMSCRVDQTCYVIAHRAMHPRRHMVEEGTEEAWAMMTEDSRGSESEVALVYPTIKLDGSF